MYVLKAVLFVCIHPVSQTQVINLISIKNCIYLLILLITLKMEHVMIHTCVAQFTNATTLSMIKSSTLLTWTTFTGENLAT